MIVLAYAHEHEVRHINYLHKYHKDEISQCDGVILFGTCGVIQDVPIDRLIAPVYWEIFGPKRVGCNLGIDCWRVLVGFTSSFSIHKKKQVEYIANKYCAKIVDMESYWVGLDCQRRKIPFVSVRYVIDRCHKKIKPFGINYFWRIFQHKRMQQKMEVLINDYAKNFNSMCRI